LLEYKKAFDSIWHTGLWDVMKSYGMDQKLIRLINAIYNQTQLAVLVNRHLNGFR